MINNTLKQFRNETTHKYRGGEQHGAKLPKSWAFFLIGKCLPSLDYDISANIPNMLNVVIYLGF